MFLIQIKDFWYCIVASEEKPDCGCKDDLEYLIYKERNPQVQYIKNEEKTKCLDNEKGIFMATGFECVSMDGRVMILSVCF